MDLSLSRRDSRKSVIKLHCFLTSEAKPHMSSETFVTVFFFWLINLAKNTPKMKR